MYILCSKQGWKQLKVEIPKMSISSQFQNHVCSKSPLLPCKQSHWQLRSWPFPFLLQIWRSKELHHWRFELEIVQSPLLCGHPYKHIYNTKFTA